MFINFTVGNFRSFKDKVVFYSNTRGELSVGDVLMTFPAGTDVDPGDFTIKFATGFGAAGSELDVKAVANGDGTISLAVDGVVIYEGKLGSLKRFKEDAKEVKEGYECGLTIEGYNDIKEGDIVEGYEMVEEGQ